VVAWLLAHPTTEAKGIETIIDGKPRVEGVSAGPSPVDEKDKKVDHAAP
jgi:hypothetical protein